MINFEKINPGKREQYLPYLRHAAHRGCFCSFGNLCMWGTQHGAIIGDHLVLFSQFDGKSMYPFPIGKGNAKPALDAVLADAEERGIPCRITGMTKAEEELLEQYYPGRFQFHYARDSFDYVYDINDLAELKGRKYQHKRNHMHRFEDAYPNYQVKPLDETTLPACRELTDTWYARRALENPDEDLSAECAALEIAYQNYRELNMEGLVLYADGQAVAMTIASWLGDEMLDVHFEKAYADIPGAYTAINREFARYIREKYPQVKFLNREEDTGSPGLRQAKMSYNPHHMVEKCWALPTEAEANG